MSDDLISRKALLKELREIMDEPHNTMFLMGIGAAISIIEHADTAFDKEKVIEELKYDKEMSKKYSTGLREQGHVEAFDEAISIVKKGGISNFFL